MLFTLPEQQALGFDESALTPYQQNQRTFLLHQDALPAFLQLKQAAATAGFDLAIVSSYRSFERQAVIWNEKARGLRTLLDRNGKTIDYASLKPEQLLQTLLYWSAAPGCSRHHWGTDIDIIDGNIIASENAQLTTEEALGACSGLHAWLDDNIAHNQSFGFFRPFSNHANAVSEEKWHLSFMPAAAFYQAQLTPALLLNAWQSHSLDLLSELEHNLSLIYQHYVQIDYRKLPAWLTNFI